MKFGSMALALGVALLVSCAARPVPPAEPPPMAAPADDDQNEAPEVRGAAGGSGEEGVLPNQLTGVPGIDQAQDMELRILDARGTGKAGGVPIPAGKQGTIPAGSWVLTDPGSEYEITLKSSLVGDGIVRLSGSAAFLAEPSVPLTPPRFRLFGGTASFYLPHLPAIGATTVLTPAGPLVTRGAVFTVVVAPDCQVLVTCREGTVYLTGAQNAEALPGQVLVADRFGRNRVYSMTPNESMVFTSRWLQVMTDEAAPVVAAVLPKKVAEWKAVDPRVLPEEARFLALWFRQAKTVDPAVPGPEVWSGVLAGTVATSPWKAPAGFPGLLGEQP